MDRETETNQLEEYWRERAEACQRIRGMTPELYDSMTPVELSIWIEVHNKIQKEMNKG